MTGRGIAYRQRSAPVVAIVAEVEVDRRTRQGVARKRFTVAHDCGLIINPDALRATHRGQRRAGHQPRLWEEVAFDRTR